MTTTRARRHPLPRILLGIAAVLAVAAALAALAIPGEAELARRAGNALGDRLGVPVQVGRLHWQLLPRPMVEVFDVRTGQEQPVELRHLAAWPRLGPLLRHRELAFDRVLLDGARIPQLSLKALEQDPQDEKTRDGGPLRLGAQPLRRAEWRDVAWVGRRGIALVFDGEADFDAQWRPRQAALRMPKAPHPVRLDLRRQEGQDRWQADVAIAGGTWNGTLVLAQPDGGWRLTGELEPRGVEVRALTETFGRKPVIAGRASGHTTLRAEGASLGALSRSLHTRTRFELAPATILRFDLDRAIRSAGKEHAGTTPLQSLTGMLDTQNDPDGIVMRYSELKARSGQLSASGTVVLQNRQVDADIAVDLVDGIVGVPLKITGPVSQPRYSVPASAIAGAAVGTAVLPGVGTALGARIGDAIGRLFGAPQAGKGGGKGAAQPRSGR